MTDVSLVFVELGLVVIGLSVLARAASRWGFSAVPLYLLAGLAFGEGGLAPLHVSERFAHLGAEIGVALLLFMLGLEYTGEELSARLRSGLPDGAADLLLNFPPGFLAALLLGWGPLAGVLLGGVTFISSSGIAAKILADLGRLKEPEGRTAVGILVLEDLAMAVYLPLVAVLLLGQGPAAAVLSVALALAAVGAVLFVAVRFGNALSRLVAHESDEVLLFSTLGLVLLVAGVAQRLSVSAAVGAFLVGIAWSDPVAERSFKLVGPLRDLFAALFFFFFGLEVNPATLLPVLWPAAVLGAVTAATKVLTGWWAARRAGADLRSGLQAGTVLVARGEFSIVIAGLGVSAGLEPALGALAAAYVLLLAALGPLAAHFTGPLTRGLKRTPPRLGRRPS